GVFFQAEDGRRDDLVTGVQTCALPIWAAATSGYLLDTAAPAAPTITAHPTTPGNSRSPSWSFTGEAGAAFSCRLTRGATVVSDRSEERRGGEAGRARGVATRQEHQQLT